jgi:hypothetical protein
MNVSSIRYQPVEGGALGGHFALHVTLGADMAPNGFTTAASLATRIHDIFESLGLKSKIKGVLIDCRESVGDPDEMSSLLQTLKDWGITIVLWVGDKTRYSWFDPSYYITVFVRTQHWPNFRVNEIRYVMDWNQNAWIEPDVYDVNVGAASYIVWNDKIPRGALVQFVTDCKRPWGIIGSAASIGFKIKESD